MKLAARAISLMLLCVCFGIGVSAHYARMEGEVEGQYRTVRLTPEVYNAANRTLSDLLVVDSNGETLPYFVYNGYQREERASTITDLKQINAYYKEDKYYMDYVMATVQPGDASATSLLFSTAQNNFAKTVNVYGSYDDQHWEFVQEDTLYAVEGKRKLEIQFKKVQKYTYYRLELSNNLEELAFEKAQLVYSVNREEMGYFVESLNPKFAVREEEGYTYIAVYGLKNLRLRSLTLLTDSMFQRTVNTPFGINKELYNLTFTGTTYTDTTLPLDWQVATEEPFELTIANYDDKPIEVKGIVVEYYADELVFEATAAEPYRLLFSGDPAAKAPVYDIVKYGEEILRTAPTPLLISEIVLEEKVVAVVGADYQPIFNAVVMGIAVLLGIVLLLRLRRTPSA